MKHPLPYRVNMMLRIVPCELDEANAFVLQHHRHHRPARGHKFSLAVCSNGGGQDAVIHGVAIVGRPVARMLDDGMSLEVLRVATDGTKNACSCLYGACRRATFALGFTRLVTYTLDTENGVSLTAAGWKCIGEAGGGKWGREGRPRVDKHPTQTKIRWEAHEAPAALPR